MLSAKLSHDRLGMAVLAARKFVWPLLVYRRPPFRATVATRLVTKIGIALSAPWCPSATVATVLQSVVTVATREWPLVYD